MDKLIPGDSCKKTGAAYHTAPAPIKKHTETPRKQYTIPEPEKQEKSGDAIPLETLLTILKIADGTGMAYRELWWEFPDSIEHEYKWMGNYGAKGEKRAPRRKITPEQIAKQNQRNRENYMRRIIKLNFSAGDLWCTLKYPAGVKPGADEVKKDMKRFLGTMRERYKNRGEPFKYIYRMEVGKQGGVHIHILCNRLTDRPVRGRPDTDTLLQRAWKAGRVNFTSLYDAGGYQQLAEYIVKKPDSRTVEQLSLFPEAEQKEFLRYSSSRNLKRPVPQQREYKRRTLRKLRENGPEPMRGYYIDKNSIRSGVNPYTGLSYYQYIEYRIRAGDSRQDSPPWEVTG